MGRPLEHQHRRHQPAPGRTRSAGRLMVDLITRAGRPASSDIEIILPAMHQAQRKVLTRAKRFNCIVCGRRWGKTTLAVKLLIETALAGKKAAYFAPTYRYVGEVWKEVKRRLEPLLSLGLATKNE